MYRKFTPVTSSEDLKKALAASRSSKGTRVFPSRYLQAKKRLLDTQVKLIFSNLTKEIQEVIDE